MVLKIFKRTFFIVALTSLIFTVGSSCKKLNKIVQFNLDYTTEAVIPSSSGINLPFNVFTPDVTTDSEASFREKDTRKDLINTIVLNELILTVKSPDKATFSFLKSAHILIRAEGIEEKEVASIEDIPENVGSSITLNTSGNDLAPYIKADKFTIKLKAVTDEFLTQDYKIEIYSKFHVEGKLINND